MSTTLFRRARLPSDAPLQDVLITSGRVTRIGDVDTSQGIDEVVDVDGRFVLPGLWDHHVHFDQWAQVSARVDLSAARTAADAAHVMAGHVAGMGRHLDSPVVGYGFRDALWTDAPHRDVLDEACGAIPVVLISADLHSAWLNSAALRRFGDPNHPSGLLRENAAMRVMSDVAVVDDEVADAWVASASRAAAARGVVGVVDMEKPWSLPAWRRRIAGGTRSLRVVTAVWAERLDDVTEQGLRTGDVVDGTDGLLTVGPLKVIADGSLNTRTAYCHEAYSGLDGSIDAHGVLLVPPDELARLLSRARHAGLECAVHAIGDRANALTLDAFAQTGAHGSIEHAQLLDDADVARFAAMGLIASVQPEHAMDDRDVADRYWAGRTGRAFVLRSLVDAGAVLAFGSDAPVAPLDPWMAIAAAVHRSRDERPRWHPEQEISVDQALAASVRSGRDTATLRVGDAADLIVLDADPFSTGPRGLRSMPVVATMLGGNWTHRVGL